MSKGSFLSLIFFTGSLASSMDSVRNGMRVIAIAAFAIVIAYEICLAIRSLKQ